MDITPSAPSRPCASQDIFEEGDETDGLEETYKLEDLGPLYEGRNTLIRMARHLTTFESAVIKSYTDENNVSPGFACKLECHLASNI
jgi:hypothetical protein